ncbi:DUF262 domain-containing protein [Geodermatophilus sp. DF01-2]|uniref:DUF262 domain-containing protein n=1 Tax=Geodermatophilus sp. DF01-2 TaxID=2559610 RepID=UPI001ADD934B|nr:DUF262 domain-containing protein [Geodermatophilus sp. DF01_2]
MAKYRVIQSAVTQLLEDVRAERIAIPELQRPFVWDSVKVRDLMDSLYKGYPVGYLITWQSVGAHLKGGQVAAHQQILIDGQQRITALRAAVAGLKVIDKRYRSIRIKIAFNPVTKEFATLTPVIDKNAQWISDISELFNAPSTYSFYSDYFAANPDVDKAMVEANLTALERIKNARSGSSSWKTTSRWRQSRRSSSGSTPRACRCRAPTSRCRRSPPTASGAATCAR